MKLKYLPEGDPLQTLRFVPGWPASDHDEPDEAVAAEKIGCGMYAEALATVRLVSKTAAMDTSKPVSDAPVAPEGG